VAADVSKGIFQGRLGGGYSSYDVMGGRGGESRIVETSTDCGRPSALSCACMREYIEVRQEAESLSLKV